MVVLALYSKSICTLCCFSVSSSIFLLLGTNGKITCLAAYFVCNSIFTAVRASAGADINVSSYPFQSGIQFLLIVSACYTYSVLCGEISVSAASQRVEMILEIYLL